MAEITRTSALQTGVAACLYVTGLRRSNQRKIGGVGSAGKNQPGDRQLDSAVATRYHWSIVTRCVLPWDEISS